MLRAFLVPEEEAERKEDRAQDHDSKERREQLPSGNTFLFVNHTSPYTFQNPPSAS